MTCRRSPTASRGPWTSATDGRARHAPGAANEGRAARSSLIDASRASNGGGTAASGGFEAPVRPIFDVCRVGRGTEPGRSTSSLPQECGRSVDNVLRLGPPTSKLVDNPLGRVPAGPYGSSCLKGQRDRKRRLRCLHWSRRLRTRGSFRRFVLPRAADPRRVRARSGPSDSSPGSSPLGDPPSGTPRASRSTHRRRRPSRRLPGR